MLHLVASRETMVPLQQKVVVRHSEIKQKREREGGGGGLEKVWIKYFCFCFGLCMLC